MANLDDIFTSDLDENKKYSKKLFGRLLIKLKRDTHIRLYSLMNDVFDTDYKDSKLILYVGVKSTFEMISSKDDLDILNKEIMDIDNTCSIELEYKERNVFNMAKYEDRLINEFGKILTIKRK